MQIKVISQVKIAITQADIEEMIKAKIAAHDSNINVDGIEFTQRRNPTRMDVEVTAHYGDQQSEQEPEVETQPEVVTEVQEEELPVVEAEPVEEVVETEPEVVESDTEETKAPETIADIFGG